MFACMSIWMYTCRYIYVTIHNWVCICMYVHMCECIDVWMNVCLCACMCTKPLLPCNHTHIWYVAEQIWLSHWKYESYRHYAIWTYRSKIFAHLPKQKQLQYLLHMFCQVCDSYCCLHTDFTYKLKHNKLQLLIIMFLPYKSQHQILNVHQ